MVIGKAKKRRHSALLYNIPNSLLLWCLMRYENTKQRIWNSGIHYLSCLLLGTLIFSSPHRFSVRFRRSGDWDDHVKKLHPWLRNHFCVDLDVCWGSMSCWKIQLWPSCSYLVEAAKESMMPCIPDHHHDPSFFIMWISVFLYNLPANLPLVYVVRTFFFLTKIPGSSPSSVSVQHAPVAFVFGLSSG